MKIRNSNGLLDVAGVKSVGYTGKIDIIFSTNELDLVNKAYYLFIQEEGKDKVRYPTTFWINQIPHALEGQLDQIALTNQRLIPININLLTGVFKEKRYNKRVKLLLETTQGQSDPDNPVWATDWIDIHTKEIDIPTISVDNAMVGTDLTSTIKLTWMKDADFNLSTKAFTVETLVDSYKSNRGIARVVSSAQELIVVTVTDMDPIGSYVITNNLRTSDGIIVGTHKEVYVKIEKPLGIYVTKALAVNENVKYARQLYKGFIKGPDNKVYKISDYKVKL